MDINDKDKVNERTDPSQTNSGPSLMDAIRYDTISSPVPTVNHFLSMHISRVSIQTAGRKVLAIKTPAKVIVM